MKKIIPFLYATLFLTAFSCDKVKNPIVEKPTVVGTNFVTNNNSKVSNSKKILLEDFTGMKCNNCPRAARQATTLVTQYQEDLIVLAVHVGDFSVPNAEYKSDFRTNCGTTWKEFFSISSFPNGVINRKNYASNGEVVIDSKWADIVALAASDPFIVKLDVTTNYDTTVGALNVDVKAKFKQAYSKAIKITVVVIEDGLTGLQLDGVIKNPDYDFEHVVRGTVNSEWGSDLTTSAKNPNDSVSVSFKDFDLKNGLSYSIPVAGKDPIIKPILVNDKKVSVVVYAYDAATKEVLQVEKVKIIPPVVVAQ